MRCLILDDEPPAREGLRRLLELHPDIEIVGEAGGVQAALRIVGSRRPEVAFVDIRLRGETGLDFLALARPAVAAVVFVTAHADFAVQAFRVAAVDYLLKPVQPDQLADALGRVRDRLSLPRAAGGGPEALRGLGLTARQAEVLYWVAHGKSNPEIAGILSNSPETVKKQVQSVLERLGAASRLEAALRASKVLGNL